MRSPIRRSSHGTQAAHRASTRHDQGNEHSESSPAPQDQIVFPVTIASIQPQKRRAGRFSLFAENGFLLGVSSETLLKAGLRKGDALDREAYARLLAWEAIASVRFYLNDLLSRRDHSRKELRDKALRKGFDTVVTDSVLDGLEASGILDEERFVRSFVRSKSASGRWGPAKIRAALRQRGVREEMVEPILAEMIGEKDMVEECISVLLKKKWYFLRTSDTQKRRIAMMSHLLRKGYGSEDVSTAVRRVLDQLR